MKRLIWAASLLVATSGVLAAEEFPVRPYTDPSQLDVPWPKHSHYKQPWRGYLETKSGVDFLRGVGVNYHVPGNDPLAVRLLAESGFRAFRIEIGFGSVRWDQTGLTNEDRMRKVLALCKQYGIRPTHAAERPSGSPVPRAVLQPEARGRRARRQPLGQAGRRQRSGDRSLGPQRSDRLLGGRGPDYGDR